MPGGRNSASGRSTVRTSQGARTKVSAASAVVITASRAITVPASRHAPSSSFLARNAAKTGMKAEPSAPPATRLKSSSGTRWAARKESNSRLAP